VLLLMGAGSIGSLAGRLADAWGSET